MLREVELVGGLDEVVAPVFRLVLQLGEVPLTIRVVHPVLFHLHPRVHGFWGLLHLQTLYELIRQHFVLLGTLVLLGPRNNCDCVRHR